MSYGLEIESLNFGYNENLILKNISFNITKGEFVSIIGPNGCGKSTLLKNLTCLCKPNSGEIKLDGKNINKYGSKELAQKISLVPQDNYIDFDFSVFDIVLMGRHPYIGRFQNESESDIKIVNQALKLTNTFHLANRSINEISGGERQRVIIARSLAQRPEIIFLDEPTSHLDINHQIDILSLLKKLNKQNGTTIILVIHDINLACRYSDKIVLMNEGNIVSLGKPNKVITRSNIEQAYKLNTMIEHNPYTNSIYMVPLSLKKQYKEKKKVNGRRVHVIAGGGTGREILTKLDESGYLVSAGVINVGDSDWETAKKLSLTIVEEFPFMEISKIAFDKNVQLIKESDMIILSSVPYGKGNLKNLEAAYIGLNMGKQVYLIDNYFKYDKFDYTNGIGKKLLRKMKNKGLKILKSIDELICELKKDY